MMEEFLCFRYIMCVSVSMNVVLELSFCRILRYVSFMHDVHYVCRRVGCVTVIFKKWSTFWSVCVQIDEYKEGSECLFDCDQD